MGKKDDFCLTHLIDGDGTFNVARLDNFINEVKLGDGGLPYAVVSILGPQGSGKSTLLNHIFHTNFKEMDASMGRYPATEGIWMSWCAQLSTIVMDLQGTDRRGRREDDTAFEKQSALFAFALSDTVLINMWCHDIGREQAANNPLLALHDIFRFFTPRKTTLMFIIRDQTKTPLDKLESVLREDIQKIWENVPKPELYKLAPLIEFFDVHVDALSSYEEREDQFIEEVAALRKRYFQSMVSIKKSASEFSSNAQKIWNAITENKDLNLSDSKGVQQKRQPIKSMANLKKIADLNLKTKVNLMKDSIFYSLSSVTKGRESSGTLVLALCKYYDYNKRGFQLNKETFFGFCTKEIAKIIGMEDKGSIYQENLDANENLEPSYVNDLRTEFSSSVGAFTVKQMKEILKNMTVNDAESKQRFRTLLTFYLIEQVLLCHRNCRVSTSLWSSVVDLDACERVNWAKATEDQLHKSMKEAQAWVEKNDSNQHIFTGATPVLEAILYERIPSMRPNILTEEEPPIQKWKPLRRDEKWMASALSKLTPSDILTCKHCSDSSENEHCGEILYPSCDAPNPAQVVYDDINCLAVGKWLNNSIMNFYLRYLQETSAAGDYHFCNTFFYRKLVISDMGFKALRRWSGGVNIFEKAYIFIPIHDDSHWSLIIICMPVKEANTGPIILHLDSLQSHDTSKIVENIARWLKKELEFFSLDSTAVEKVHVPRQNNSFDCGVYVLL